MKRVALIVFLDSQFTELVRAADMLKLSGKYSPMVLFAREYINLKRDMEICRDKGMPCFGSDGALISGNVTEFVHDNSSTSCQDGGEFKASGKMLMPAIRRKLLDTDLIFFGICLKFVQMVRQANKFMRDQQPDMLIFAEDNVGYVTSAWINSGHRLGIPSVVIPYTVSNATEPAETFFDNPAYSQERWDNRLVCALYPRWSYEHKGRKLIRLPAPYALATELLGLSTPRPWEPNCGHADKIIVESEFMRDHLLGEGLPEEKLAFTGSLNDVLLAENLREGQKLREKLYRELGMPPGLPMILCALPPDQHKAVRMESDFATYSDLIRFWVQSLSEIRGYNIVLKLHPRLKHVDMRYLEQDGIRLCQHDTAYLIPLCDTFVASVSATIRWAIACGKPVLNYDCYRYRYNDYAEAGGVITVEDKQDFATTLSKLAKNSAFYKEIVAKQEACKSRWGNLDGKAGERMLQLFDHMTTCHEKEE